MDNAPFAPRPCRDDEADAIADVINDGASAYRGVIPPDRWKEPYMPVEELRREIAAGVRFWGSEAERALVGVMGIQDVNAYWTIPPRHVETSVVLADPAWLARHAGRDTAGRP